MLIDVEGNRSFPLPVNDGFGDPDPLTAASLAREREERVRLGRHVAGLVPDDEEAPEASDEGGQEDGKVWYFPRGGDVVVAVADEIPWSSNG